jgi:pimeloyl-ACP methyl ester carboxylesterase
VSARAPASVAALKTGPIRMETLEPNVVPPTFVMRGEPRGPARIVFLHGMCGHGLGYAQAFQFSAAKKGTLIAPQGDVSCGGVWSKWSTNLTSLDARITETFRALGAPEPGGEVVIIGMSQGATRAIELARKFPERYTRLVAMAAPTALERGELSRLRGAVLMAGERDRRDLMLASQRALSASGVPATFLLIPGATHGAMGPTPEATMNAALEWLWQNSRS